MAITRDDLDEYVRRREPLLFHVTDARNRDSIVAGGLVPGSEMDKTTKPGFFHTRAGHVYLCRHEDLPIVEIDGERLYLQVELAKLDPERINPDEDMVSDSFDAAAGGWVGVPPRKLGEGPEHDRALASWAETTPGFDSPEVSLKSLNERGRIAYRGTIPPDAISVVELRSEIAAMFLSDVWRRLGEQLPDLVTRFEEPPLDFSDVEIGRAMALAELMLDQAAQAAGLGLGSVALRRPEEAGDYETAFRRAASAHHQADRPDLGNLASEAADVAEKVLEIKPSDGWWMCRQAAIEMTAPAAGTLTAIVALAGPERGQEIVEEAMMRLGATDRSLSLRDLVR